MLNTAKSALFLGMTVGLSPLALALIFGDHSYAAAPLEASDAPLVDTIKEEKQEVSPTKDISSATFQLTAEASGTKFVVRVSEAV